MSHPTSGHYFEYCEKPIKGIKNREKICYNENIFNETDACRPSIPANIMAPKLQVKQIAPTVRVWTDSGSGADKDGSFWTASEIQLQNDFKLLGEISCIGSYSNACHSMILVQDSKESILVEPVRTEVIWTNEGSDADSDLTIYRLFPPSDQYKCLGGAVVASSTFQPDLSKYNRCVKVEYLKDVGLDAISWDARRSGAWRSFAAYNIAVTNQTVAIGTFYGVDNYNFDATLTSVSVPTLKKKPCRLHLNKIYCNSFI